jgi:hypothetical protein
MDRQKKIDKEKQRLIQRIANIDSMRKGTISEQIIKTGLKDGSIKENGPYYILTAKDQNGKTITESIPKGKLEFFRQEIEKYKEFKDLANQYEILSEESSKLKSAGIENETEKLKKNRKLKQSVSPS